MHYLKDKLIGFMGTAGCAIWFVLSIALNIMPLFFLNLPFIVEALLIGVILFIPFWDELCKFVLWVWSFILVINAPFSLATILYYISLVIYIIITFPLLVSIFTAIKSKISNHK